MPFSRYSSGCPARPDCTGFDAPAPASRSDSRWATHSPTTRLRAIRRPVHTTSRRVSWRRWGERRMGCCACGPRCNISPRRRRVSWVPCKVPCRSPSTSPGATSSVSSTPRHEADVTLHGRSREPKGSRVRWRFGGRDHGAAGMRNRSTALDSRMASVAGAASPALRTVATGAGSRTSNGASLPSTTRSAPTSETR